MFLDLHIPTDDPLRPAKIAVNTSAPGFRLFDQDRKITWESDFIWLMVLNEEDGLDFKLKQTIDGEREIEAFWKDHELGGTEKLRQYLAEDDMWQVYQLRAVVLLQLRVESQLEVLRGFGSPERDPSIDEGQWSLAARLRTLEGDMLQGAYTEFEDQVRWSQWQGSDDTNDLRVVEGEALPDRCRTTISWPWWGRCGRRRRRSGFQLRHMTPPHCTILYRVACAGQPKAKMWRECVQVVDRSCPVPHRNLYLIPNTL